jgi:hypothetical protein
VGLLFIRYLVVVSAFSIEADELMGLRSEDGRDRIGNEASCNYGDDVDAES